MARQKQKKAATGAGNMKMFYVVLAVIAVLGIGAILYARSQGAGMATEPIDLAEVGDVDALLARAQGVQLGEESAPVHLLVFSDFMCPACAHWTGRIESQLKPEFIDPGVARITYYDFPLGGTHRYSFVASRAARCAGDQGRFWEYHDVLFARQQSWSYSASVPADDFMQIARDIGLDEDEFESCLRSDQHAEVVTANRLLGESLGVSGTPTVFLNGRQLNEWSDYAAVREAVREAGGV